MRNYFKLYAQLLATVLAAVVPLFVGDNMLSSTEWVNVAIVGVGAASVWAGANVPGAVYTKTILSVFAAVLTVLASVIVGGVTPGEWAQIIIAGLGALGVFAVKAPGNVRT